MKINHDELYVVFLPRAIYNAHSSLIFTGEPMPLRYLMSKHEELLESEENALVPETEIIGIFTTKGEAEDMAKQVCKDWGVTWWGED